MVGKTLGHYEILELLGKGGMGEVYLGEDSRLGRKVAIKVLPAEFASDPERLARFKQEARAAAALNHPHIAVVHDIGAEEVEGGSGTTHFMVQEYLEGETLREPLKTGALPLRNVLSVAAEIAEALVAAHEAGIIHRDLKPDNIFITKDGHAKVLDFGLAKLTEMAAPDGTNLSMSPTMLGTVAGQVMGTAGYMAPEQAAGVADIDQRADLFAFGSLLYEMATGRQPFVGRSVAETLSRVQHEEPAALDTLDDSLPPELARIIGKSLEKDAADRYQHADDLLVDLRGLERSTGTGVGQAAPGIAKVAAVVAAGQAPADGPRKTVSWAAAATAALVVAVVSAAAAWILATSTGASTDPAYFTIKLPAGLHLWGGSTDEARIGGNRPSRNSLAVAPDGRSIVFAATDGETSRLYLRRWSSPVVIPIVGADGGSMPFFSPDGRSVGFYADGSLRAVSIDGGEPWTILPETDSLPTGFVWAEDDTIVGTVLGSGIVRFPARGGRVQALTEVDAAGGETNHALPFLLPGGDALLYTIQHGNREWQDAELVVQVIGGDPEVLFTNASDARYVPTGHIVFARDGVLMAAGFDVATLSVTSDPVEIRSDVMHAIGAGNSGIDVGAAQYSHSAAGALAFATGGPLDVPSAPMLWVSDTGEEEPLDAVTGYFIYPRISPDGGRIAFSGPGFVDADIIIHDLASGGRRRLRIEGSQTYPSWSRDGQSLAFRSDHEGESSVYVVPADLSEDPVKIIDAAGHVSHWSRNGTLVFRRGSDIWVLDTEGDADPRLFVEGVGRSEGWPAFSPDGNWLAYATSTPDDVIPQVFVVPYPRGVPVYRVTADGGTRPAWSHDGTQLFYRTGRNNQRVSMMAVDATIAGDAIEFSAPRLLFDSEHAGTTQVRTYDVAADGRFLMIGTIEHAQKPVTEINIVLNWFEELKERVPTGR